MRDLHVVPYCKTRGKFDVKIKTNEAINKEYVIECDQSNSRATTILCAVAVLS